MDTVHTFVYCFMFDCFQFTSFSLNHIHCILQAISIESLKFLSLKLFGEGKKRTRNSHLCVFTETINSAQLSLNNILYLKVITL